MVANADAAILHRIPSVCPWMDPQLSRLPGLKPIALGDWFVKDAGYAQQMGLRDKLLAERRSVVTAGLDAVAGAATELLDAVMTICAETHGFTVEDNSFRRCDGVHVPVSGVHPLVVCARLVQEDLLILTRDEAGDFVLRGGVLCFPAFWSLAEKLGRPMRDIHRPVAPYTDGLDDRISRILSRLDPDRPLMRANLLIYTDPNLHQPAKEGAIRVIDQTAQRYVRVERQVLRLLPKTGALVFSIHTSMTRVQDLPAAARHSLRETEAWRALGAG